jgi:hypothetical protein
LYAHAVATYDRGLTSHMAIIVATPPSNKTQPIVTLRSLFGGAVESEALETELDSKQQQQIERYNRIVEKLQEETAKSSSEVLITVQDRDASMLQSRVAEAAAGGNPLPAGGVEAQFGQGVTGGAIRAPASPI